LIIILIVDNLFSRALLLYVIDANINKVNNIKSVALAYITYKLGRAHS
jgi:hypothetical protein